MIKEIRKEYEQAKNAWTGCDWHTIFGRCELNLKDEYSDSYDPDYEWPGALDLAIAGVATEKEYRKVWEADVQAAKEWLAEVENDAALAAHEAKRAMEALENDEYQNASVYAKTATLIEMRQGLCLTWCAFAAMCKQYIEENE